ERTKALVSHSWWNDDEAAAREAYELARQLGDVELRSHALGAVAGVRWWIAADYQEACALIEERLELLPELSDPDHHGRAYWNAVDIYLGAGRIADARRSAAQLDDSVGGLTPPHRVHGLGRRIFVESMAGDWSAVGDMASEAERATEANLTTPCPLNVASLLWAAQASVIPRAAGEA